MTLLLLTACLERVTGETKALPEAFTAGASGSSGGSAPTHSDVNHNPNAGPSAGIFADVDGETVTLSGRLISELDLAADLDVQTSDPNAPGGMKQLGKVLLPEAGEFAFQAPVDFGDITIQAFQDADGNGPSDDDPFGVLTLSVGDEDITGLELKLIVGGRSTAQLAAGSGFDIFGDHDGDWTVLKGKVLGGLDGHGVDFDVRVPAHDAASGDAYLGKVQFTGPGDYAWKVPRGYGELRLQVFQDTNANGPDGNDPFAQIIVHIGDEEVVDLDIQLNEGAYAGPGAAAPSGGGSGGIAEALFDDLSDPVVVRGTITAPDHPGAVVDIDVFAIDAKGHGGRRFLGKLKTSPGPWSFQAPRSFGQIELEAMIDENSDGPTPGDPRGVFAGNPLNIGGDDIDGIDIEVSSGG